MTTWQAFVIAHGFKARLDDLAFIVGQPAAAITRLRHSGCRRRRHGLSFPELFTLWHGRSPVETDWPAPRKFHAHGQYEWQPSEQAVLASLIGRVGPEEIATTLTTRLRERTGDPTAVRTRISVIVAANKMGMTTHDVVGGKTVAQAARELGTRSILDHYIRHGKMRVVRVGRLNVIPHSELERFRAQRVYPPQGYVRLTTLRQPLGIRSDSKLPEYAVAGHIPTAIRCNPTGTRERSTQYGTWYIHPAVAKKLIADRRAGRPMPWWGQLNVDNAKRTYALWRKRQHPSECRECQVIWGGAPPATFEEYCERYPAIAHGAKRHMTMPFKVGLSRQACADKCGVSIHTVQRAIDNGMLRSRRFRGRVRISESDAALWKGRRCPQGLSRFSWLAIPTACKYYGFTRRELLAHVRRRRLKVRIGENGPQRNVRLVAKQQIRELRDELGFSEREAARRIGVSVARLRVLLRALEWRGPAQGIPLEVLNNARQRLYSKSGSSIAEAARAVGKSIAWVEARIQDGTVRVLRTWWNKERRYLSAPMLRRLRVAATSGAVPRRRLNSEWLLVSDAATLAGVCSGTIQRYAAGQVIQRRRAPKGFMYHRRSVMAWARAYWQHPRYKRTDQKPAWLIEEERGAAA